MEAITDDDPNKLGRYANQKFGSLDVNTEHLDFIKKAMEKVIVGKM